jgi:fructokinase
MIEHVIGIDLGGTKVEACLLDTRRNCLSRRRVFSEVSKGLEHVMDTIAQLIHTVAGGQSYLAVGLGTPGTFVEDEDRLYGSPHTSVYTSPGFLQTLKRRLSVPIVIENDANCLALAEFFEGCIGKYHSVMAVILGTGVGSGLILNDKLYRGFRGGGGEIGHSTIDIHGRLCECGRRGCVEAYLSGPSLSRRFAERSGKENPLEDIYRLYRDGNSQAIEFFEENVHIMGEVFANVINILDLDAIILGGGVSNLPVWYDKVPEHMNRSLFGVPRDEIPIIKAKLGDSAGVIGAAYLALHALGYMEF